MKKRNLIITEADQQRLVALVGASRMDPRVRPDALDALDVELWRAQVVPPSEVPPDVVTMNSIVRLRDLDSGDTDDYELVDPPDADVARNRISILAPIGTAILGYRVGDVIKWPVPAGVCRLRVEEVLYQPERAEVAGEVTAASGA